MTGPKAPRYRAADGVVAEWLFDEMVILDTRTGWRGAVNLSAAVILEMFAQPMTAEEAIAELTRDIGLDPEAARTTVEAALEGLLEQAILEVSD